MTYGILVNKENVNVYGNVNFYPHKTLNILFRYQYMYMLNIFSVICFDYYGLLSILKYDVVRRTFISLWRT